MNGADALVLCGGLGTRIRHMAGRLPKVLLEVGGRPFLELVLERLRQNGVTRAILCVGADGGAVRAAISDGSRLGILAKYSHEEEPMGTAGALAVAAPLVRTDPFVVLNGDTLCDASVPGMIELHRYRRALATVAVDANDGIPAGAYVLSVSVLAAIPRGRPCSLEREVLPQIMEEDTARYVCHGFTDIGTPAGLAEARRLFGKGNNKCDGNS